LCKTNLFSCQDRAMRLFAVAAFIFIAGTCASAQDTARPAKVLTVQETSSTVQRRYPAIVQPSQESEVSFKVSGQVVDLPIRASSELSAGDVIAELDKRPFIAALEQITSQRDQAQSQLDALLNGARAEEIAALQAAVAAAQAQLTQAEDQVERARQLAERGTVSQAKLDQDEAAASVASAQLDAAREDLALGRAGARAEELSAAEAVLRGLDSQVRRAQDNLNDATLRAPFDGVVARRDIENFSNIQGGQSVVLLQALSTVDLAFDVPGPDVLIWSASEDTSSKVELDARPGVSIDAELVEFSTQADSGTQTYRARVSIEVPEGAQVLPGMVGSVIVSSSEAATPHIAVPLTAIAADPNGGSFIWVVDPATNAVSARDVTLGDVTGASVAVKDGLVSEDMIVTAGVSYLREGAVIRPITKVGE
jgi:RND family efflux transporter MFP subunit